MENHCKELDELLKKLRPRRIIYTSNRGNNYHFIEFRNGKLFFDIPNHVEPINPRKKLISKEQFCRLLKELIENKILLNENLPFKDCRKAGFYGFVNQLYPNQYIKNRQGIMKKIIEIKYKS